MLSVQRYTWAYDSSRKGVISIFKRGPRDKQACIKKWQDLFFSDLAPGIGFANEHERLFLSACCGQCEQTSMKT